MNWVAIRMLLGDRAKYFGLVFGVAFATLLMAQQASLFAGLVRRAASTAYDVRDANVWVMDSRTEQEDSSEPIPVTALQRVRGVAGVAWAVPLLRANTTIKTADGIVKAGRLIGVDDATFIGLPQHFILGSPEDLRTAHAVVLDKGGYEFIWPGQPFQLGRSFEMNDKRAIVVGIVDARKAFSTELIIYSKYNDALDFTPGGRNRLTYVIARAANELTPENVAQTISIATGLRARSSEQFRQDSFAYIINTSGITFSFVITISLGFIVGVAIVGLTFSLFVRDNIKQFGALKAIGVGNWVLLRMVVLQAAWVGVIGYCIGIGMAALFFNTTKNVNSLSVSHMPWQIMLGAAGAIAVILLVSGFGSMRKVLKTDPAIVFRG